MTEKIGIDKKTFELILQQLIRSDMMEVQNDYLIQQKIYYIENTKLIEDLEKLYMEHNYQKLLEQGNVNYDDLLNIYTPQFINYDKFYRELKQKYKKTVKEQDSTLNRYFNTEGGSK